MATSRYRSSMVGFGLSKQARNLSFPSIVLTERERENHRHHRGGIDQPSVTTDSPLTLAATPRLIINSRTLS
jgi:hypothetical protein